MYLCVIAQYSDAGCSAFRTAAFRLICTVLLWAVDKVRDAKTHAGALGLKLDQGRGGCGQAPHEWRLRDFTWKSAV
jgi:hypothetical protein